MGLKQFFDVMCKYGVIKGSGSGKGTWLEAKLVSHVDPEQQSRAMKSDQGCRKGSAEGLPTN